MYHVIAASLFWTYTRHMAIGAFRQFFYDLVTSIKQQHDKLQTKNDVIDQPQLKQQKLLFFKHIYSNTAANKDYKQLAEIWKL